MKALLDFLVQHFLTLWPIVRVREYETAFIERGGLVHRELLPGLRWRWPLYEIARKWPKNLVSLDLKTGAVADASGQSITVSANVLYRLLDIRTAWRSVWNFEASISGALLGLLCSACAQRHFDDMTKDRAALEAALRIEINTTCEAWGVTVERINLTDLLPTEGRHFSTDGSIKLGAAT